MGKKKKKAKKVLKATAITAGLLIAPETTIAATVAATTKKIEKEKSLSEERKKSISNYNSEYGYKLRLVADSIDVSKRRFNPVIEERFRNCIISDYKLDEYIKSDLLDSSSFIVCETNPKMKPHNYSTNMHKDIHELAGKELEEECKGNLPCYIGQIILTDSYKLSSLKVNKIIHFISPMYDSKMTRDKVFGYIRKACSDALTMAKQNECHCVVFPNFHVGENIHGKNEQAIADTVMSAIYNWMNLNSDYEIQVIICTHNRRQKYKIAMDNVIGTDISPDSLAIVFQGGGAKGAFQLGVWDVLQQEGIAEKIAGFSGTSIGAISTLLCVAPVDMSEKYKIWKEFEQSELTSDQSQHALQNKVLSFLELVGEDTYDLLVNKYDIYNTECKIGGGERYINWKRMDYPDQVMHLITNSANHFIYLKNALRTGKADGGAMGKINDIFRPYSDTDNTNIPIQPLYDIGYRNFIVVYLKERNEEVEKEEKIRYGDARFFRIYPYRYLGKMKKIYDIENDISIDDRINIGKASAREYLNT